MSAFKGIRENFNWAALIIIGTLLAIGMMNLTNADYYAGTSIHKSQAVWIIISVTVALLLSQFDHTIFEQLAWVVYGACLILLIAVTFWGVEINHSRRWFRFGAIGLQPSEFIKAAMVILLARFFSRDTVTESYRLRQLWRPAIYVLLPCVFIMMQPDLGTSLLIVFVGVSMMLYEGLQWRSIAMLAGIVLLVMPLAWKHVMLPGQKDRVLAWLKPEVLKLDKKNPRRYERTTQPRMAKWAVGSGRFFGKGSRKGTQTRLKYLPEIHTDFSLAVFAEEHGFLGCSLLLSLFYLLVLWMFRTSIRARSKFGALLAFGFGITMFWQIFINIGMVVGLLPVVGLPLPFMSKGGSFMLTTLASVGITLNVALGR